MSRLSMGNADQIREQIRQIFVLVLRLDPIHDDDNFFDLGGDSVMALLLAQLVSERLSISFDVAALYANQTVAEIADFVGRRGLLDQAVGV